MVRGTGVIFLGALVAAAACSRTMSDDIDGGTCNSDADCLSADEVCRGHKCINKNAPATDASNPGGDASTAADANADRVQVDVQEDPFATCTVIDVPLKHEPVVLELVLDGSGSMGSDNKWTAAVEGLSAFFDVIEQQASPSLAVGMLVFADAKDPNGAGPYPNNGVDVPPAVVDALQAKALRDRILTTSPSGGTPTKAALTGGITVLTNYAAPAGSPLATAAKAAMFISDGQPNGGAQEQAETIDVAKAALAIAPPLGPIRTYSVGVGAFPGQNFGYDPKFMSELAIAGGTRASPNCDPMTSNASLVCHFQITPGISVPQMKAAFLNAAKRASILANVCELPIDPNAVFDPSRTRLTFVDDAGKATVVPADATRGWSFDDDSAPTKIMFNGKACDAALIASEVRIEACEP